MFLLSSALKAGKRPVFEEKSRTRTPYRQAFDTGSTGKIRIITVSPPATSTSTKAPTAPTAPTVARAPKPKGRRNLLLSDDSDSGD